MTPADLIAFENDIANDFNAGKIKSPVHLAGGNEEASDRDIQGHRAQ
jgi:hypothetical protein